MRISAIAWAMHRAIIDIQARDRKDSFCPLLLHMRDPRMLMRYANLRASDLADQLW